MIMQLRDLEFKGIAVKPGTMAVSYGMCFFDELIIKNTEDINFEEVSISFHNCYIRQLTIEDIHSTNISVHFHACMLSGTISAGELISVSLNNCLLEYSIFLLNLQKVELSYTTENIFLRSWREMFKLRKINSLEAYLKEFQRYHIENIINLHVRSSRKDDDKPGVYLMSYNTLPEYKIGYKLKQAEEEALKVALHIDFTAAQADKTTKIENLSLHSLSLSGNPGGKVTIEKINVGNWYLSEFSPKEEVSFYNIDPRSPHDEETKMGIHRCNLDKVWFDNVYFGDFDRLSFYRSKFSNAVFTSCSFPNDYETYEKFLPIENIHYPGKRTINHHKDQYEIFLQLKKALEATGNIYEGLKLQTISQTALSKISSVKGGDKFILSTNHLSNNHGLSISKPFFWFIGVTVVFYLFYLLTAGLLFKSTDIDPDLIGYYFSFIDITHRTDFLKDKNADLNALSLTLDYFNKVIVSYLIFQFVAAFRKYGKK